MDNNSRKILAFILCLWVVFVYKHAVWDRYFNPQVEEVTSGSTSSKDVIETPASKKPNEQISQAASQPEQISPTSEQVTETKKILTTETAPPSAAELGEAGILSIETDTIRAELALLGGRVNKFELKDYRASQKRRSPPLDLILHGESLPLPLGVSSGGVSDIRVLYELVMSPKGEANESEKSKFRVRSEKETFRLKGVLPDGRVIEKQITFLKSGYLFDVNVKLSSPASDASRLSLDWTTLHEPVEQSFFTSMSADTSGSLVWFNGEKAERRMFPELKNEKERVKASEVVWLSLTDKYFTNTILSKAGRGFGEFAKDGKFYTAHLEGGDVLGDFSVYAGPMSYARLKELGSRLELNVNLGWTALVSAPLLSLLHFFYGMFGNYGLAIVVLTIVVRAALFPLNSISFKQMKAMQALQPEIKRLRETVTDKQQQQVALMTLYKKKGVNPLGGCLPMLVQLPIFIGLFFALLGAVELRHAHFALWIHDLSAPERLEVFGFGIPIMVILMVVTMIVQQATMPSTMDPVQKKVMLGMNVFFGFLFAAFPAGLTLYYLVSNLISIAQQRTLQNHGNVMAVKVTGAVSLALFLLAFVLARVG